MEMLEKIHAAELSLLKVLCSFLEKNHLRYYLVFGTLLGAVRHKGFIPWDDDVDIAMPREDYNKLLAFPDSSFGEPFRLFEITRTEDYYNLYAKFIDRSKPIRMLEPQRRLGLDQYIWIDIFPLDGLPENKIKSFFIKNASIVLRQLYMLTASDNTFPRNRIKNIIIKFVKFHFPYKKLYQVFLKLITLYSYDNSCNVASITEMNTSFYVYPKNIFGNSATLTFEDGRFNVPEKTTTYLEMQYGDYMKLPPEEERHNHAFVL
ncbi:MAG: LicD family protein [Treponema sp.]|jgi:lipopolysaccharide cholinephosphotransferase|nr:LicD family protein [Treponema sp.]